ncbi:hypothetical protein GCM10023116_04610 [Kistimonas scapharcae]|uniref:Uncharacterized protein n=1 Tax=Kistimonas scapharcae TaxID=1036133 RepID=A0ABP8UWI5_9GAMM
MFSGNADIVFFVIDLGFGLVDLVVNVLMGLEGQHLVILVV